jgi:hypothetical protein
LNRFHTWCRLLRSGHDFLTLFVMPDSTGCFCFEPERNLPGLMCILAWG